MQIVSSKSEDIKKQLFDLRCPRCGWTNRLCYSSKINKTKRICKHCGYYIFKDKKEEYNYRLKELGVI